MAKGRKRLTSAQMRARGNPRWVERAGQEKAEQEAAKSAEGPSGAEPDADEGEPWDEPSGQLHGAIVDSGLSGREVCRRVRGVRHANLARFIRGGADALSLLEFDRLCVHFRLTLANEVVLEKCWRELERYRREATESDPDNGDHVDERDDTPPTERPEPGGGRGDDEPDDSGNFEDVP